ncbi:MAG: dephospho-CoA kinase [Gammaproteobacteria bacterium]|nr:dephospho-CoA kinase [Gammaproteobacteria bacterium]
MLRIGLTGGIGSGKSTVCTIFRELGVPVIDSDEIARELVVPGSVALQQITARFGPQVLRNDGSLDRQRMRDLVFDDPDKRQQLEAILHPLIRQEMERQIARLHAPYLILAIPLLLEKGWQQQLDRVLVIDCNEELQRQRATRRDGSPAHTIDRIIASQIERNTRLAAADDCIDNSGSLASLRTQVEMLHHHYLMLGKRNGPPSPQKTL